jgi:serine/threonine protein kinase
VVKVYDLGEENGQVYMAMELLEGDDLRALIERREDIKLPQRLRILIQICEGLAYAHEKGVVHRDVKPANILVSDSGTVKLLDFGLARVATRETITRQGIILGTPDYMSPEQAMGRSLDHRTDIFSSGAVFYEFLTLHKPFPGTTLHSVLYRIISEEPEPVLSLQPELPARLARVVHWMLAKKEDRRPVSMRDVAAELGVIHAALCRSGSRSALPPRGPLGSPALEDGRARGRELVARGRRHVEAGRWAQAAAELSDALAADPESGEAAELLWRCRRRPKSGSAEARRSPEQQARVAALLERVAPGAPEAEARKALAELALIAPDEPRLVELLRERSGSVDTSRERS